MAPPTPSLPSRIQEILAAYYGLEGAPLVDDFIEVADDAREALLVRELGLTGEGQEVELCLRLPRAAVDVDQRPTFDEVCQIIEGVSHFLYLVERARRELPATHLELELQAEIDKYVLLASARPFEPAHAARIRARLFERVAFLDAADTETGARYRLANDLAARFAGRLEQVFARHGRFEAMRRTLRRFYAAGQTGKIELARAA